ncbi:MAG: 50S ribosomal protein L20 [Candidatus Omnitrophica bacterium]|nr:50S ribosomal protein L20 [Candidatus Omnitrophota bacterium]MDD5081291.1 50S ribosomal protein L20 [Candidatus Omnitrophota bacterium]MDD5441461.1 50S ribosomal protein L20 [Candidatus Omnitrophota bacterium]
MKAKNAPASRSRKKKVLERAKGYWGDRSKRYRRAAESVRRALAYAYRDRRNKKRVFRSLWITRINAAAGEKGIKYSEFISNLRQNEIMLSRDMLAKIAAEYPQAFDAIVGEAKLKKTAA